MRFPGIAVAAGLVALLLAQTHSELFSMRARSRMNLALPSSAWAGILEGQVLFDGAKIPVVTRIENTTDPQYCQRLQSLEDVIISPKNKGIKNVIVALKGIALPKNYKLGPERFILDNRDCQFQRHVAVLTTGSTIEAVNSDPMFHSVHLYGLRNLNIALGPKSSKAVPPVRHPGYIIVKCDIHGWMRAFIRVDDHPFHAVSADDGSFRIKGVPPGSYTLEAWHERFGPQEMNVTVTPGTASRVTIYYRVID